MANFKIQKSKKKARYSINCMLLGRKMIVKCLVTNSAFVSLLQGEATNRRIVSG